jgi:hypothetical protein
MKKKIKWLILLFLILQIPFIALSDNSFKKIKIYLSPWKNKYNTPTTIENIKDRVNCSFQTKRLVFGEHTIFEDYETWCDFITKQTLFDGERIGGFVSSYAIIYFRFKKVKLFFDYQGRFYYNKKWYKRNEK